LASLSCSSSSIPGFGKLLERCHFLVIVLTYVFEHTFSKENNLSASFNEGFQALVEVCQETPGTFDEKQSKNTETE